ncbi:hypothetical protein RRG08_037009 [Elysia crispata]|uniref:Uncharacterized protein n=1 Tax=Elysia crispata TaxID=231223 RepID=A0AAE0XTJ6_9GAST|nr:hypothetical protein RRG08_037009 [Elysia crispata]
MLGNEFSDLEAPCWQQSTKAGLATDSKTTSLYQQVSTIIAFSTSDLPRIVSRSLVLRYRRLDEVHGFTQSEGVHCAGLTIHNDSGSTMRTCHTSPIPAGLGRSSRPVAALLSPFLSYQHKEETLEHLPRPLTLEMIMWFKN